MPDQKAAPAQGRQPDPGGEPDEMGAPPDGYPGMQPGERIQPVVPAPIATQPPPATVQMPGHWRLAKILRKEMDPKDPKTVMNWAGDPGNITTYVVYARGMESQSEVQQQWIWTPPPLVMLPDNVVQGICQGRTLRKKDSFAGTPLTGVCSIDLAPPNFDWSASCIGQCSVGSTQNQRAGGEQGWKPSGSGVVKAPPGEAGQAIAIRIGFQDLAHLAAGYYYVYEWQVSQVGNETQQWCQVNCSRLQQCRADVENVIGAKNLADSIGTSPQDCEQRCAEHYTELTPKCKSCLMTSCRNMGACLKETCKMSR